MGSRKIKRGKPKRAGKESASTAAIFQNQPPEPRPWRREPEPQPPIAFEPDSLKPEPFRMDQFGEESDAAMVLAGIKPEIVYAHRKTGLIVTRESYGKLPKSAIAEWEAAVEEYFEMVRAKAQGPVSTGEV